MLKPLPLALYRAAQVRAFDRIAIEGCGIPGIELMARAAAAALRGLRERWPAARRLAVLCGNGNNAGDGYLIADLARRAGLQVTVIALSPPEKLTGDAQLAYQRMCAGGLFPSSAGLEALSRAEVLVDALLGTGLNRDLDGPLRAGVDALNLAGRPILAVDIPTGLHADTGAVLGAAVMADLTVSFIALKQGLFTAQARAHCGEVVFDDLEVPAAVFQDTAPSAVRVSLPELHHLLGQRARTAHKGHFGHVLVVGGNKGFAGAIRLAANAAARAGAGLVSVATHVDNASVVTAAVPELMVTGVSDAAALRPLLERATVLVAGPGFGRDQWARSLGDGVLAWAGPKVLDADLLNLIAESRADRDFGRASATILTPHPAEAARLLGVPTAEVEGDRFGAAAQLAEEFRAVVVLKGAGTLVCAPGSSIGVCEGGNPGMATGGMGDVLSGIIGAFLAQHIEPLMAARLGVCVHAAAADAAAAGGERGLLASDVITALRAVVNPGQVGL